MVFDFISAYRWGYIARLFIHRFNLLHLAEWRWHISFHLLLSWLLLLRLISFRRKVSQLLWWLHKRHCCVACWRMIRSHTCSGLLTRWLDKVLKLAGRPAFDLHRAEHRLSYGLVSTVKHERVTCVFNTLGIAHWYTWRVHFLDEGIRCLHWFSNTRPLLYGCNWSWWIPTWPGCCSLG